MQSLILSCEHAQTSLAKEPTNGLNISVTLCLQEIHNKLDILNKAQLIKDDLGNMYQGLGLISAIPINPELTIFHKQYDAYLHSLQSEYINNKLK